MRDISLRLGGAPAPKAGPRSTRYARSGQALHCASLRSGWTGIRAERSATANEVDNLQAITFRKARFRPPLAGNDVAIQFHGHAILLHAQAFDQFRQGQPGIKVAVFAVDLKVHGNRAIVVGRVLCPKIAITANAVKGILLDGRGRAALRGHCQSRFHFAQLEFAGGGAARVTCLHQNGSIGQNDSSTSIFISASPSEPCHLV